MSLFPSHLAKAQELPEFETIFSKKANRNASNLRLYGGMNFNYLPVYRNAKVQHLGGIGFDMNVTYKKKYLLGLSYTNMGNIPSDVGSPNAYTSTNLEQLVAVFMYKPRPEKAFHAQYSLKIGSLNTIELTIKPNEPYSANVASGIIVNPNFGVEANLFPWLGLQVNAGYVFVGYENTLGVSQQRNSHGVVIQAGFVLGNLR